MHASRLSIRSVSHDDAVAHEGETERDPLLGSSSAHHERVKKPWFRPRPLWLVPFAVTATLCRSMTLAPRTEVFTKIACEDLWQSRHHHTSSRHHDLVVLSPTNANISHTRFLGHLDVDSVPFVLNPAFNIHDSIEDGPNRGEDDSGEVPPIVVDDPPVDCLTDPAVQADAARLQTIMTTTMGILSALTTGWWGQFGDQHGRTKVIACAVAGLLFTDIMFIIASNPPEALRGGTRTLLVVAPVVEGLLGGWSTLQGTTYAYISDCTSNGSRAHIFSRFTGVFFTGIAVGPEIAALILRSTHNTTIVFYTSAGCAFINLVLVLFVFPESLSKDVRARNVVAAREARSKALQDALGKTGLWRSIKSRVVTFFKPLRILGPRPRAQGRGWDWSMTIIATALFCHFLTLGLFQIKYLYAAHVFSWDAEELSYYITIMGSARALHLLFILPIIIRFCRPVSPISEAKANPPRGNALASPVGLRSEVKFDLLVAKVSLGLDVLSQVLVSCSQGTSQVMFVAFTMISGFGAGLVPALQSVAMSTILLRGDGEVQSGDKGGAEVGKLFGAIAMLQAAGNMILGPMLFGTVYSLTVAQFPKTIFIVAAALLFLGAVLLLLIRSPQVEVPIQIRVDTRVEVAVDHARGRSRKSKDIRPASLA